MTGRPNGYIETETIAIDPDVKARLDGPSASFTSPEEGELTKGELIDLIASLGIVTQYYCDNGQHVGEFRVIVSNPYIRTETWDLLQRDLKPER